MLPLLSACGPAPDPSEESTLEPEPTADYGAPGPFTPATDVTELTYGERTLTVQLWFPTQEQGSEALYDGLVEAGAVAFAAPDCSEQRPVVVFSHGSQGVRWQSWFLMERLASHGWVVAAPDHRGNTWADDDGAFAEDVVNRPRDIAATFDALVDGVLGDVADCVDADAGYTVAGHSFGGYTAFAVAGSTLSAPGLTAACDAGVPEACEILALAPPEGDVVDLSDDRVRSVVPMAPWDAGVLGEGQANIPVAALVLGADHDESTPMSMARELFDGLTSTPRYLGRLEDAGHYSFAPFACLLLSGDGCGEGYRDADEVADQVALSVLTFLGSLRDGDTFSVESPGLVWEEEVSR